MQKMLAIFFLSFVLFFFQAEFCFIKSLLYCSVIIKNQSTHLCPITCIRTLRMVSSCIVNFAYKFDEIDYGFSREFQLWKFQQKLSQFSFCEYTD